MKKIVLIIFSLSLLLSSCGSNKKAIKEPASKPVVEDNERVEPKEAKVLVMDKDGQTTVVSNNKKNTTLEYINQYADIAKKEMKEYRIPASITIAQGILESNNGNGELTRKSNNHFGIKCHRGWEGSRVYHDDDKKGECFRVYADPATSYQDHSIFLSSRKRYASLFKLKKDDYKSWAHGLRMAGYATDNRYPQKLIKIIEKYKLYRLDNDVIAEHKEEERIKKLVTHTVLEGETLFAISRKYRISCNKIKEINDLESNTIYIDQVLLIKPKSINEEIIFDVNDTVAVEKPKPNKPIEKSIKPETKKPIVNTEAKKTVSDIINKKETLKKEVAANKPVVKEEKIVITKPKIIVPKPEIKPKKVAPIKNEEHVKTINGETQTSYVRTIEAIKNESPDFHIVKKGETLYMLAYKYGLEVPELRKLNGITKNEIRVGQKIKLKEDVQLILPDVEVITTYTVAPGDTLYKISREQGISLMHLKKINSLKSNSLKVGQVLRIR